MSLLAKREHHTGMTIHRMLDLMRVDEQLFIEREVEVKLGIDV